MKKILQELVNFATYRGGEGHWSFFLHRVTGVGVLLFLIIHVLDTALIGWGPDIYNRMIALYRLPFFRVGEIGIFAAVLYHALNGVRVILVDFWPRATRFHRQLFWGEVVLFVVIMVPVTVIMALPILKNH